MSQHDRAFPENDRAEIYGGRRDSKKKKSWRDKRHQDSRKQRESTEPKSNKRDWLDYDPDFG